MLALCFVFFSNTCCAQNYAIIGIWRIVASTSKTSYILEQRKNVGMHQAIRKGKKAANEPSYFNWQFPSLKLTTTIRPTK